MNFLVISLNFLLISAAQAIDIFGRNFARFKCVKGRILEGCNCSLIEAYNKTEMPKWNKPDQNMNDAETYFMLFTEKNKDEPEYLDECGGSLPTNTNFDPKKLVVVIIHGYLESVCKEAWQQEMKIQFLCRGGYNVILVDYGWGNQGEYADAMRNIIVVAKQTAFVMSNIMKVYPHFSASRFHIVGHSLGSQVGGLAGQYFTALTGLKVRRITALDPAGPGYIGAPLDDRLDKDDAVLVDVLHTNAGNCIPFFGYPDPCGHADFYINDGTNQFSCISNIFDFLLKANIMPAMVSMLFPACSHQQSFQYFKVSILPCLCEFVGFSCDSLEKAHSGKCNGTKNAIMGLNWEKYFQIGKSGVFNVNTIMTCPYCDEKYMDILRRHNATANRRKRTHCFSECHP